MRALSYFTVLVLVAAPCSLGAAPDPTVRIGVFQGYSVAACAITSKGPVTVGDESGRTVAEFPPGARLAAEAQEEMVALSCADPAGAGRSQAYVISSPSLIEVRLPGGQTRAYRGRLLVSAEAGGLCLVNELALEDYLRGVVPAEIPADFGPEALRAQAIAARTYTLVVAGRHASEGFDLCDRPHCQVYLGASGEDSRTDEAVRATSGLIVTHQGMPIHAVYHNCCGGRTAANETAWSGSDPLPYLRPVVDCQGEVALCSRSPESAWTRRVPQAKLAAALSRFNVTAPIAAIEPASLDEHGRPGEFVIWGAGGSAAVLAGVLRTTVNTALGWDTLPSADFTAAPAGDLMVFEGRGNGHGVGLCQRGANALANAGRSAAEILAHYYTGVAVEPLSAETIARLPRQSAG